jgi:hypothetical protein
VRSAISERPASAAGAAGAGAGAAAVLTADSAFLLPVITRATPPMIYPKVDS